MTLEEKLGVLTEVEDEMYHQCFECDNPVTMQKWDNASRQEKLKFVEGLMGLADNYCVSKADWEMICKFMLDEVHSCKLIIDEYANKMERTKANHTRTESEGKQ